MQEESHKRVHLVRVNKAKNVTLFGALERCQLLVGRLTTLRRSNAPKFINFWCFYKDSMLPHKLIDEMHRRMNY